MKVMYSLLSSFVETDLSYEFIMLCVLAVLKVGFNEKKGECRSQLK